MSAVEGSLGFLPRRILVDADQTRARAPAAERGRPRRRIQRWLSAEATSLDAILGGRLRLRQTRAGHRVGLDAVLLAAAAGAPARGSSMSAPASARSAWRCCSAGRRRGRARRDRPRPGRAGARERRAQRPRAIAPASSTPMRSTPRPARRRARRRAADLVVTNPPFFAAEAARVSPDARRARAHVVAAAATARSPPGSSPPSRCSRPAGAS